MVIMPADCHVSLSLCSTDFVGSCLKIGLPSPDTEHTVRVKEHSECAQACVCIAKWFRALQSAPVHIVLLPSLLLLRCSTRAPVLSSLFVFSVFSSFSNSSFSLSLALCWNCFHPAHMCSPLVGVILLHSTLSFFLCFPSLWLHVKKVISHECCGFSELAGRRRRLNVSCWAPFQKLFPTWRCLTQPYPQSEGNRRGTFAWPLFTLLFPFP